MFLFVFSINAFCDLGLLIGQQYEADMGKCSQNASEMKYACMRKGLERLHGPWN